MLETISMAAANDNMMENSVIIIHGYSLLASNQLSKRIETGNRCWEYVVWGDPEKQILGRIPYGILKALLQRPKILILGSGATCIYKDVPITRTELEANGSPGQVKWEADFTFETLQHKFRELIRFKSLNEAITNFGGIDEARDFIKRITVTDVASWNSRDELFNALAKCETNNIKILRSISNPSHAPRCLLIALKAMEVMRYKVTFVPDPCESDFSEDENVVIFEPQSGPGPKQEITPCDVFEKYFNLSKKDKILLLKTCQRFFKNRNLKHN